PEDAPQYSVGLVFDGSLLIAGERHHFSRPRQPASGLAHLPSASVHHGPRAFSNLGWQSFRRRDVDAEPSVLIGGQVLNYWAEDCLSAEPEPAQLRAFNLARR